MKKIQEILNPKKINEVRIGKTGDSNEEDRNIIMQLRKVVSLRGNKPVVFDSGEKKDVDMKQAQKALTAYENMNKPNEKFAYMKKLSKNYKSFLSTVGDVKEENIEEEIMSKDMLALYRKSEKHDVPFPHLVEVYNRGIKSYRDDIDMTKEQFAFARVNSFIHMGAAATMDDDLVEGYEEGTDEARKAYAKMTPGEVNDVNITKFTQGLIDTYIIDINEKAGVGAMVDMAKRKIASKNYHKAIEKYQSMAGKGKNNLKIAFDVSKLYQGVDSRGLMKIINGLVDKGKLPEEMRAGKK